MNDNIRNEITRLKKSNSRNSKIIVFLLAVLIFVSVIAIYVRVLGWI